ncbi:MAG: hypothetical protein J5U17_08600 [Candidatus Methanoperedens sp.]|nr:hypothetical protein [Candidatus Methanoperedens sp.]MCE8429169.1 hypothetical protein [Candidatus Methanoperedens sp.]
MQFEKDHPAGITVSGMFIVCYHRATKMSGIRGAHVERFIAAESMLESRAPVRRIHGFAN